MKGRENLKVLGVNGNKIKKKRIFKEWGHAAA
jgi:hypothetical protein